ncbi:MAG: hypothetical protein QOI76_2051 [Frankiales bacterium]|nr:hypothetical protein [Frankiales bacterium]
MVTGAGATVTTGAAVLAGAGFVVGDAARVAPVTDVVLRAALALTRVDFVADRLLGAAVGACRAVVAAALGVVPAAPGVAPAGADVVLAAGTSAAVRKPEPTTAPVAPNVVRARTAIVARRRVVVLARAMP